MISTAGMVLVLASLPAYADGMPEPYTPLIALKPYNWTGFYAGLQAGGAFSADTSAALSGDPKIIQPFLIARGAIPQSLDPDPSGFIGGVQAGYNWQKGKVVIGLEADISYSSLDDGDRKTLLFDLTDPAAPVARSLDTDIEWFSTVRGRIGFLPHEGLMIFATGGLAFGETQQTLRFANIANVGFIINILNGPRFVCLAMSTCLAGSNSETSVGWTGGWGFAFAVSDHVTLKGEYLYVDVGSSTVTARATPAGISQGTIPGVFLRARTENKLNVIRAGVNVKLH